MTRNLHYEIELVAALGSGAPMFTRASAGAFYGYAVGIDLTGAICKTGARRRKPWDLAKASTNPRRSERSDRPRGSASQQRPDHAERKRAVRQNATSPT